MTNRKANQLLGAEPQGTLQYFIGKGIVIQFNSVFADRSPILAFFCTSDHSNSRIVIPIFRKHAPVNLRTSPERSLCNKQCQINSIIDFGLSKHLHGIKRLFNLFCFHQFALMNLWNTK